MGSLGIALTLASLGAGAFGALESAQANNELKRELVKRSNDLDSVFNRDYNQDYMETPGVKNTMAAYANTFKEANKNTEGRAVMSGATPEATIAEKEKTNQNYGDFTRKVASNADAYRERMKEEYQQRSDILKNQIFSLDQQRASQWSNLMGNAANLGVAGIAADSIQKKPEDTGGGGAGAWLNSFLASKNPGVMNDINNNPGSSMNGILKKNLINQ